MNIQFSCHGCGQRINVPDNYAGKKVRCPKCQTPMFVPGSPMPAAETPPAPTARTVPATTAQPVGAERRSATVQISKKLLFIAGGGAALLVLISVILISTHISGNRPASDAVIGIWYCESEEKAHDPHLGADVHLKIKGTTEYLRNGSTYTTADFTVVLTGSGQAAQITYSVLCTGEWQLHEDKLIDKMTDMKSTPLYVIANGVRRDVSQMNPSDQAGIPHLEDMIPKGVSVEQTILETKSDSLKLKRRNAVGDDVVYVAYKRDKAYKIEW
jgi:hypothetical protein